MSVSFTLTTTAEFERRESVVEVSRDDLMAAIEDMGWRTRLAPSSGAPLLGFEVHQSNGQFETHVSVHGSGSLSWGGNASPSFDELLVGWYLEHVDGREEVYLYTSNGDLIIRMSLGTYLEDLARIHTGWREQRDIPPGLDLG